MDAFEHDGCCDDCGTDLLYDKKPMYFVQASPGKYFCEKCVNEYNRNPSHSMIWVRGQLQVKEIV